MRVVAVVPAYQASSTVGDVVSALIREWPVRDRHPVIVVDDGSTDGTSEVARKAGAQVVSYRINRGKGCALRAGFAQALLRGATHAVSSDADGQHPTAEVIRVGFGAAPEGALVLGVRDLVSAGAPRANRFSNSISNYFVSLFSGRPYLDTNCGLRRYPLAATLALGAQGHGFGYEVEVLLRAASAGWRIVEVPVEVLYPPEELRQSHFNVVRDPTRIVVRVLATLATRKRSGCLKGSAPGHLR